MQGIRYAHTFSTAEVMVPMKCDVHAWMNAWIGVVNHPYFAVTGTDGAFTLPNLPPAPTPWRPGTKPPARSPAR